MSTSTANPFQSDIATAPPLGGIAWQRSDVSCESAAAAFEDILAHDLDRLYRVAFSILRNREDAEDALQEALWKAHLKLSSFAGRSSLSTWLTRIVINSALMVVRRRNSHPEFSLDEMMETQPELLALRAADKRPGPEQMCHLAELIRTMEIQFLKLSDEEQAVFRHFVIEGHSIKDSASAFGVPAGTFKSRILRTRRKLAQGMRHTEDGQAGIAPKLEEVVYDVWIQ